MEKTSCQLTTYFKNQRNIEECIRALFNIYGIPKNTLYSVKEFGNAPIDGSNKNKYIFDNEYYVTIQEAMSIFKFLGNLIFNQWSLKFHLTLIDYMKMDRIFRLISLENNWLVH